MNLTNDREEHLAVPPACGRSLKFSEAFFDVGCRKCAALDLTES